MTVAPDSAPASGWGIAVTRVLAIAATAVFGIPFLFFVWLALSSRFGWGAADVHGYAMLFGTFLALVAGIVVALVVPLIFRRGRRAVAYLWSMFAYLLVAGALIVAIVTV